MVKVTIALARQIGFSIKTMIPAQQQINNGITLKTIRSYSRRVFSALSFSVTVKDPIVSGVALENSWNRP